MSNIEQTISIIKPDAVERNLTEEIKKIFIKNNLKILNSKKIHISRRKPLNSIKFTKQSLFIMIYALIYHLGLFSL